MKHAIFTAPQDNSGEPNKNIAFQTVKQQLVTILTEEGVRNEKHLCALAVQAPKAARRAGPAACACVK